MLKEERTSHSPKWFSFQVAARRVFNRVPVTENQKIYLLTMIIGCVCGLAAVCFHLLLDFLQEHIIYRAATIPRWWIPLLIFIPAIGGLISGAGRYFYAPAARRRRAPPPSTRPSPPSLSHWKKFSAKLRAGRWDRS